MQISKLTSVGMLCIIALGASAADFGGQMSVEYEYDRSGREVTARIVNGERQEYKYDRRGQLLSVCDADGRTLESYRYDAAGNIVDKRVLGVHTEYTYDAANQLVKSVTNGVVTNYAYDAAGRMIKEGNREYSYSGLDKVDEIRENGKVIASYSYHTDGQLAMANYGNGKSEEFTWDGLALIGRNEVGYLNEPSVTGGNPISANGQTMFNDMLGSTLGISNGKNFSRTVMTSFGAYGDESSFYTGKPKVDGLGYTFNYRNYRADQGKWQTADPLGYPDGFNNYAYVNNGVTDKIDYLGLEEYKIVADSYGYHDQYFQLEEYYIVLCPKITHSSGKNRLEADYVLNVEVRVSTGMWWWESATVVASVGVGHGHIRINPEDGEITSMTFTQLGPKISSKQTVGVGANGQMTPEGQAVTVLASILTSENDIQWGNIDYNLGFTFDAVKNLAAGEFGLKGGISFPTYYAQNSELFLFAPKTKLE